MKNDAYHIDLSDYLSGHLAGVSASAAMVAAVALHGVEDAPRARLEWMETSIHGASMLSTAQGSDEDDAWLAYLSDTCYALASSRP